MNSLKELRAKAHTLDPIVRIGKSGLTDSAVIEIKKQLRRKKLIKIKLLSSAKDVDAGVLAEKTDALLVQSVGNVIVLSKKFKN